MAKRPEPIGAEISDFFVRLVWLAFLCFFIGLLIGAFCKLYWPGLRQFLIMIWEMC